METPFRLCACAGLTGVRAAGLNPHGDPAYQPLAAHLGEFILSPAINGEFVVYSPLSPVGPVSVRGSQWLLQVSEGSVGFCTSQPAQEWKALMAIRVQIAL
jgi:hypothetical protein